MKGFRATHTGRLKLLTLSSILVALSGCISGGSSPTVRFYTLTSMEQPVETRSLTAAIGVGPIVFPDYLKRPQIVTRSGTNRIEIAEYDRWAEPLDAMFQRTLVANLDSLMPHHNVITYPFGSRAIRTDYRVVGRVSRFETDETGLVTLEVQWVFSSATDSSKEVTVNARHTGRANTADGYAGIVTAMSETLESFSRELASNLANAISS